MERPEYLCHYTSVDVLCKLFTTIKSNMLVFHASSVFSMNDKAEYKIASEKCRDGLEEILMDHELGIPFAICFTDCEDNIPMWYMYTNKGKGVCLKFSFEKLKEYFDELFITDNIDVQLSICDYQIMDMTEKQKPLDSGCDYPNVEELRKQMKEAAFIKPLCFRHENEWRLTVWQDWIPNGKQKILFKERHDELCPYIEIPIPVDCLETIVLSPNANWHMIDAVKLLRANYGEPPISITTANFTLKV